MRRHWFVGDSSADYALLLIGLWFLTQLNPAIPLFGMVVLPEGLPQPYVSPLQDPQLFLMLIEGGSAAILADKNTAPSLFYWQGGKVKGDLLGLKLFQHSKTVHAWHHNIHQDQLWREGLVVIQCLLAAAAGMYGKAANSFQGNFGDLLNRRVVFNMHNAL